MILSAQSIRERCKPPLGLPNWKPMMIFPFFERKEIKVDGRRFSYGLSSAGYDIRIAETIWLWPYYGRLASSIEQFDIPNDILVEISDKSSWIRRFVILGNSKGEPGWKGHLTLELMRWLPWPIKIKAGTPIAHLVFHKLDKPTEQPYCGKYQNAPQGPQKAI